ncbi:hypothetical protein GJ496_009385 [Pomphorhynchus laevis]|nr:hypothetical protein GJ496_009385 [Pomphorhynchus laevis]
MTLLSKQHVLMKCRAVRATCHYYSTLWLRALELFPDPSMWLAYSADDGTTIAIPAANEAVPKIEWRDEVMSYDPESLSLYRWRRRCFILLVWERNNCPGDHRARINKPDYKPEAIASIQPITPTAVVTTEEPKSATVYYLDLLSNALACSRVNALPRQYIGHVRIRNFFNFESRIENWFWDVGDVTHILPDSNIYRAHSRHNELGREISNELLYAIAYAPLLGIKYYPSDVRGMLDTGNIPLSMPLVIAAKSENTKTSLKTRETYSANDILREVTAEFDRAAVPLASLYEASTMRKGSDNLSKIFSPGHGDDIIVETTRSDEVPRCACYVPLLLNTLAQGAREPFPDPSMWLAYSADDGTTIAIPAANEAVPKIE